MACLTSLILFFNDSVIDGVYFIFWYYSLYIIFMICISVNLFCSYIVFPPAFVELSSFVLLYFIKLPWNNSWNLYQTYCKSSFISGQLQENYCLPLVLSCFLDFFMFFEVLHYWFHIWNNYLLPVCTDWLWRETPSGNPVGDFEAIPNLVYWYPCSILFVSPWEDFHCLAFSVLQSQARCWQPPICSH